MKFKIETNQRPGILALLVMSALALGWSPHQYPSKQRLTDLRDTLPNNKDKKDKQEMDLDQAMRKASEGADQAARAIENFDWKSIQEEIENSVDLEKIQAETRKTVQRALKNIDLNNVRVEIDRNAKKLDEYFNSPEFQKQMDELKKLDDQKIKRALDRANRDLQKSLEQLRREWNKERKEAKEPA